MNALLLTLVCFSQAIVGAAPQSSLLSSVTASPLSVVGADLLARPADLDVRDVTLVNALRTLQDRSGVPLAYSPTLLPAESKVSCPCSESTVGAALRIMLPDESYSFEVFRDGVLIVKEANQRVNTLRAEQLELIRSANTKRMSLRLPTPFVSLPNPGPQQQQVGTIVGRATDVATGLPVSSASIFLVGTEFGTLTNEDGRFRLAGVPVGEYRIRFERIGYQTLTKTVTVIAGSTVTVDFALGMEPTQLDEIVVTATGEMARREVGNVIGSIDAEGLAETMDFTDVSQLLTGRTPGVEIIQSTGTLGAGAVVRVRGINSMSLRNDPLVIIDGIRYETGSMVGTGQSLASSGLSGLNPNEIESIDVIKGPAAAALYGTAAANGVLVVKTKRGEVGPTRWSAYMAGGINQQVADFPDNYRSWGRNTGQAAPIQCRNTDAATGVCAVDSLTTFNPLMNPETTPYKDQNRFLYGLQARGGNGPFTFFISGEVADDTGPYEMPASEIARLTEERGSKPRDNQIHPNQKRQYSVRSNFGLQINPKARARVSVGYSDLAFDQPFGPGGGWFQGLLMQTLRGPGYKTAKNGNLNQFTGDIFSVGIQTREKRFTGSVSTEYDPLPWLSLRASGGIDNLSGFAATTQLYGEGVTSGWGRLVGQTGGRSISREQKTRYTLDVGGTGTWDYNRDITLRAAFGAQYFADRYYQTYGDGFSFSPGASTISAASDRTVGESTVENSTYGAFLEGGLTYQGRLFFTTGIRTDKNSAFGVNQGTVLYPRASVSWVIAEESFFPFKDFFDDARLRVAWGRAGVQPGSTAALAYYNARLTPVGSADVPGLVLGSLGNPRLKPETTTEYEFGADFTILDGRMTVEATYFNKQSKDALIEVELPPSVAAGGSQLQNLGAIKNTGFELAVDADPVTTPAVTWHVRLSGTLVNNEVVDMGPIAVRNTWENRTLPGYPIGGLWARPILGWNDANGDGILVESEIQVGDTLAYRGPQQLPPRQFVLTNSFDLFNGRAQLMAQINYAGGHYTRWFMERDRCAGALNCRAVNDPTAPLDQQAAAVVASSALYDRSEWGYLQAKDYVRLRELALTIPLPPSLSQALPISSASLTLSGRNLWMIWTDYPGLSPEATYTMPTTIGGLAGDGGVNDFDWFSAPPIRTWTARVNVNF